ncbi:beta-1,3-galactosyltransferase 5-like [Amblyomma americanum]
MTIPCKFSRKLLLCVTTCIAAYIVFLWYLHASHVSRHWDIAGLAESSYDFSLAEPTRSESSLVKNKPGVPTQLNSSLKSLPVEDAVDNYTFRYILNKPTLCSGTRGITTVLIVVITSSINFAQRNAIRSTWGQAARRRGYKLVFLVGTPKLKPYQSNIVYEDTQYGDILQADFVDSYRNLTLKSITMVRWASLYCPNASLLLKIDDDMLLNVWDLASRVQTLSGVKRTLWGLLAQKWTPQRNPRSKWYVSTRAYRNASYPDFLAGPAYLLSGDSVPLLARGSSGVPYLYLEDVFLTGIVAEKMGVRRVHDEGFLNYRKLFTPCTRPRILTSHGYTPLYLKHTWRALFATAETRNCDDGELVNRGAGNAAAMKLNKAVRAAAGGDVRAYGDVRRRW